ncbi:MAG TPA: alpha/beta hydrolase-fold protein [Humibacter sp.]|nr:alpha/beta hydrolase-fold protein [Humibacter sp.]
MIANWLLSWHIDSVGFLTALYVAAGLAALVLLARRPITRTAAGLGAAAIGASVGLFAVWLADDVFNVFGVTLTPITRMWVAIACSGAGLGVFALWHARLWRRVLAILAIPLFVLAAAAGINVDFGAYRSVGQALDLARYPLVPAMDLHGHAQQPTSDPFANWRPPATMPAKGIVEEVKIPASRSGFSARPAAIYLPPAARVPHPPALPVIIAMAGQPGSPADMMASGRLDSTFDEYAAQHDGLAPIVVAPDQLGRPTANPMCIDSRLGNSATYLTVDVPAWIRSHLKVIDSRDNWAVAGYSQGATCSVQFVVEHPDLFGTAIAVLSELRPTIGADTFSEAFGGSRALFAASAPIRTMTRHAPYADTRIVFGEAQNDRVYAHYGIELAAAAEHAGIHTELITSPGTAHDWHTVRYVFARTFPELADRWGLNR